MHFLAKSLREIDLLSFRYNKLEREIAIESVSGEHKILVQVSSALCKQGLSLVTLVLILNLKIGPRYALHGPRYNSIQISVKR